MTDIDFEQTLNEARLSIDEARRDPGTDLFVVNTCDHNGLYDKGDVILNIATSDNSSKKFRISVPDTWVPWELSHFAEKARWFDDMHFVAAVRKGTITLIDPDVARQILKHPDGQAEYENCMRRVLELQRGHALQAEEVENRLNTMENREKVRNAIEANKSSPLSGRNTKPNAEVVASAADAPNVKVMTILNNRGLDETAKINALRNIQRSLKPSDFKWILNNVSKDYSKLKEWVVSVSK